MEKVSEHRLLSLITHWEMMGDKEMVSVLLELKQLRAEKCAENDN